MHESTEAKIARIDANVTNLKELMTPLAAKVDSHGEKINEHAGQLAEHKRDRKWIVGLVTLVAGAGGHGIHKVIDWFNR